VVPLNIDLEQCRENDKIKEIISSSNLPIKHIKLLLRLSDAVYLNALNYNVVIDGDKTKFVIISSKPDNKPGVFNTTSLSNVLFKLRELKRENKDIKTKCQIEDQLLNIIIGT
jgi:hypothetical protein